MTEKTGRKCGMRGSSRKQSTMTHRRRKVCCETAGVIYLQGSVIVARNIYQCSVEKRCVRPVLESNRTPWADLETRQICHLLPTPCGNTCGNVPRVYRKLSSHLRGDSQHPLLQVLVAAADLTSSGLKLLQSRTSALSCSRYAEKSLVIFQGFLISGDRKKLLKKS